ncbi:MAG: phosphatidylglycerophosphatase A [Saprospiraceae bacterium]|nr:phosphatidylglycerophosphatase A [Saprospiraceae bacterium]
MTKLTIARIVATFGGFGYLPLAPGTWGSLAAAIVYLVIGSFFSTQASFTYIIIFLAALTYFSGVWSVKKVQKEWGSDPSKVVIDEACGIFVTMLPVAFSWTNAAIGFVLFRIFDIWKPLGIRKIDQIKSEGGHSVMLDDVAAGIYAAVVLGCINAFL